MSVSETRKTQAIALDLASALNEAADELADMAMKTNVHSEALFDTIFRIVNSLREETLADFNERTVSSEGIDVHIKLKPEVYERLAALNAEGGVEAMISQIVEDNFESYN